MGFFRSMLRAANPQAVADDIILRTMSACEASRLQRPDSDPHAWLTEALLAHWTRCHRLCPPGDDHAVVLAAYEETRSFALFEWPTCARVLCLNAVVKERPDAFELLPALRAEVKAINDEMTRFAKNGQVSQRYKTINPFTSALAHTRSR